MAIVVASAAMVLSCSPSADEESADEGLTPGCYATADLGTDNLFVGPINSVGNAVDFTSLDGSCTGERADDPHTLVHAESKALADEQCRSLGEDPAGDLDGAAAGYPVQYENVWRCGG